MTTPGDRPAAAGSIQGTAGAGASGSTGPDRDAGRLGEQARGSAGEAKKAFDEQTAQARRKADELKEQAKEGAARVADEARARAQAMLHERKDSVAQNVADVAGALRKSADELERTDKGSAAVYVDQAASSLNRLADHLRGQDIQGLVRQTEDFARRQPGVFIGGAIAAGFALSRFLRSSAEQRAEDEREARFAPATSPASPGLSEPPPSYPSGVGVASPARPATGPDAVSPTSSTAGRTAGGAAADRNLTPTQEGNVHVNR